MGKKTGNKRQSPAVYRRRRLVALLGLAVIVGVIWLLIAQPWNSSANTADPVVTASPSASVPAPEPSQSAADNGFVTVDETEAPAPAVAAPEGPICLENAIQVSALTTKERFASDEDAGFLIKLHNAGTVDCIINVGTAAQSFAVLQGEDVLWNSKDCQTDASEQVVLLSAGETVQSSTPLLWDKTKSDPEKCGATDKREEVPASGTSYNLRVSIGGVSSNNNAIFELF